MAGDLLIVRHGPERGRPSPFLDLFLPWLAATDPAFHSRVRVAVTGAPPPSLEGVRAAVFFLADPLREMYPDCYAEASAMAAAASQAGIRVLQHPDSLSNSIKSVQARLWQAAGLHTPRHWRFEARAALLAALDDLPWPLLSKSDERHAQRGMRVLRTPDDARALAASEGVEWPVSVAEFIDTREDFRSADRRGPYARYFHKRRATVLGPIVHAHHVFFSDDPIVSSARSTFDPFRYGRRRHLLAVMPRARACVREDVRFASAPLPDMEAEVLRQAARALRLDVAAIDYAVQPDGGVILWEANPYFYINTEATFMLPRERDFTARRHRLFADAKSYLGGALGG